MSEQGNGIISPTDLMSRLVQAKKVMNKVETGNYEKGNVNEEILRGNPEDYVAGNFNTETPQPQRNPARPMGVPTPDRIKQSKLPDAIKKAMIENPIPQITLNDTIDMDIVKGARRIMEREGMISEKPKQQSQSKYNQGNVTPPQHHNESFDMNALAILIENTVRRVMDEKLTQLLSAHDTQSINENLVLKVGDSIFKGKITGVNKSK